MDGNALWNPPTLRSAAKYSIVKSASFPSGWLGGERGGLGGGERVGRVEYICTAMVLNCCMKWSMATFSEFYDSARRSSKNGVKGVGTLSLSLSLPPLWIYLSVPACLSVCLCLSLPLLMCHLLYCQYSLNMICLSIQRELTDCKTCMQALSSPITLGGPFTYFFFLFFCVPQLYLWGSPFLGEIFAYVTVF